MRCHILRLCAAALILAIAVGVSCSAAPQGELAPTRSFTGGEFVSTSLPELVMHFPEAFVYVGATTVELTGEAFVERHHLVDADSNGRMVRLVILHFEGFVEGHDQTYNYRIPDEEHRAGPDFRFSATPVRLGTHDYVHNTWFFDAAENIRVHPDRELGRTAQFLGENGYELPAELAMSRYVRVVDAKRKHEFILFYLEPLDRTGFRALDFVAGGTGAVVFDSLSAEITSRSRNAFHIGEW